VDFRRKGATIGDSPESPFDIMGKLDKLLLILNLLHNRPYVTIDSIRRECHVSERTAYRYVRSLSSARFPVHFDSEVKGYRLIQRGGLISHLASDEAAMILFGLVMLESSLGQSHLDPVRRARTKLEAKLSADLQEIITAGKELLFDSTTPEIVREHLIMSLVRLADVEQRSLRLDFKQDHSGETPVVIQTPRLVFDNEWMISPKRAGSAGGRIPIRLIRNVTLV
jgi:predicted DNA-binding transcriptional regulator YafY